MVLDLRRQFQLVPEGCEALGFGSFQLEGYEADDLIASFAKIAEEAGHDVIGMSAPLC